MELVEYTNKRESATLTLTKTIQDNVVVWQGTMYNTNGRIFPVVIARKN